MRGFYFWPRFNSSTLQDLICSVTDIMEPKRTNTVRLAATVTELVRFYTPRNNQTMNI